MSRLHRNVLALWLATLAAACAAPQARHPHLLDFARGCWTTRDGAQTMRLLPPHPASPALIGVIRDTSAQVHEPERMLLEPTRDGLMLVRTPAGSGATMETYLLVGGGPQEAEFAGPRGARIFLQGGQGVLQVVFAAGGGQAVLFRGERASCGEGDFR